MMRKKAWQLAPPKRPIPPAVANDVREKIEAQAVAVVADLKERFCKKPKEPIFNWPEDLFVRWHRNSLYIMVVMRTPHGRPPTFETHAAKMEHADGSKFNLAVPMRRGWNTFIRNKSVEECFEEIRRSVYL